MKRALERVLIALSGAVLTTAVCVAAFAQVSPAQRLLQKANLLIASGKAGEAQAPLEELRKLFPRSSEAAAAGQLLKKTASLEVLIDRSHEWRNETRIIANYLRRSGIGVTLSDASLGHLADRLDDYEMVLVWQQGPGVTFSDSEIELLRSYLQKGGRLLAVGTTQPVKPYPLCKLLGALRCPMKGLQSSVAVGAGRVKFFNNRGLFDAARLADPRESEAEVVEIITTLMPYEKLKASNLNEQIDPEHTVRAGAVKLQFSGRLKARAAQVNSLLESILKELKTVYHDDLPDGIIVRLLPRDASGWMGGVTFVAGAYSQGSGLARDLSRAVALYALFPRGEWVSYPPWVEYGWCDLVALRVCFRIGFRREAEVWRKDHQKAFNPSGKDANAVDLSVSRNRGRGDYIGKSQWLLEVLEKQYGKDLLNRLRTTLAQHAAAGKLPSGVSTRQMICFLSVTVQENLFGYFLSIGTNVLPMKLDLPGGRRVSRRRR